MKARVYPAAAILSGLAAALIISGIHVFISNTCIFQKAAVVLETGYLSVPNAQVARTLTTLWTAFCGGVFFTLSMGAGLCVLSFFAFWIWDRVLLKSRSSGAVFVCMWALMLVFANVNGFSPAATAHILCVPVVVCVVLCAMMPKTKTPVNWKNASIPVIGFILLTALWCTQLSSNMFINIRDNLLLTTQTGVKINTFYYKYTLYAAEAFKPLQNKTLKTADLDGISDHRLYNRLEKLLRIRDYLPVKDFSKSDISVVLDNKDQSLSLRHAGATILTIPANDFLDNPDPHLNHFSAKHDTNTVFRRMTFAGLLVGYPMVLYILIYTGAAVLSDLFLSREKATWAAAVFCFIAGIAMLYPVNKAGIHEIDSINPKTGLYDKSPLIRAVAIRKIIRDKIDIAAFKGYEKSVRSPFIPERYYLARAMGKTRDIRSFAVLKTLLNDKNPNVVCQALWALGERGRFKDKDIIINTIAASDHWYVQWYGYRALRKLGWVQKKWI